MPQNTATFTFEDYNFESSNSGVNIGPLTAANFTAKRAAINTLETAAQAITLGELRRTSINEVFAISSAAVSSVNAQRERKWLVTMRDNTQFFDVANTINNPGYGNLFKGEWPTADLSLLTGNSDTLDLTVTAVATFVTALEAVANSPTGGNECIVTKIEHVGRNL